MKIKMLSEFSRWFKEQKDHLLKTKILKRLDQLEQGNFGDYKSIGEGISELRINYGPGYRIYYTLRSNTIVILLCGGDKSNQKTDIEKAKKLSKGVSI